MNSKERVMTAVNLAQPDRVPMDFGAEAAILQRLHQDFGTKIHMGDGVTESYLGWRMKFLETAMDV